METRKELIWFFVRRIYVPILLTPMQDKKDEMDKIRAFTFKLARIFGIDKHSMELFVLERARKNIEKWKKEGKI